MAAWVQEAACCPLAVWLLQPVAPLYLAMKLWAVSAEQMTAVLAVMMCQHVAASVQAGCLEPGHSHSGLALQVPCAHFAEKAADGQPVSETAGVHPAGLTS